MSLRENLKPVADAPHETAIVRELDHRLHQRRKASNSAGTQVVSVREAAGQYHAVGATQIAVLVPQHDRVLAGEFDCMLAVAIGPSTGKDRDAESHLCLAQWGAGRARIPRGTGSGRLWRPRPSALARGTTRAPRWPRSTLALPASQRGTWQHSQSCRVS